MSIRLKLVILFIAVALIPLFFITNLIFLNYKTSLKKTQISALEAITVLKTNQTEDFFEHIEKSMVIAQQYWNIRENMPIVEKFIDQRSSQEYIFAKKTLDSQLTTLQKVLQLFDVMLIDTDGIVVYCSNPKHEQKELGKRVLELQKENFAYSKNALYFSTLFNNPLENNAPGMFITAPAYDNKNNVIGGIVFSIDMQPFYKLIENATGLGKTGETIIAKKVGNEAVYLNPLKHDPKAALKRKVTLGDKNGYPAQQAVQGKKGTGIELDYRGEKTLASWQYLPDLGWGIITKIDEKEAFGPINVLSRMTLITAILISIVVIIISLVIAKSISDPIQALNKATESIGKGDFEYKIVTTKKDEIGQLSRAFNRMEKNLKESQEKLAQSERFAALGKLAGFISHELRNPLGVMKNVVYYLDMLGLSKDNPEVKKNLDMLSDEIVKSDKIIGDLLEFSRIKKPNLRPGNVNAIINEISDRLSIGPDIKLLKELQADLPNIAMDALHIHQVFYNIAQNALQAMKKGGTLTIETALAGDFIETYFRDTGIGIPKENFTKIFEPLFSTKPQGTGLGLAICNMFVAGHGGKIEVESEVGKGTTFVVKLPISRG